MGSPAADLACDEALLDAFEAGTIQAGHGILRLWEATQPYVVLGYANRVRDEVNVEAAAAEQVPIYRRCSGGGCVLQNRGCLNYSLILPVSFHPRLESITETNCFIMQRNRSAVADATTLEVTIQGYTDLTLSGRNFSGNSQRRKIRWVLFHGTFLLAADFPLMERILLPPPRQPEYRQRRSHADFLACLPCPREKLGAAMRQMWNATEPAGAIPRADIQRLVSQKYSAAEWNLRW